MTHQKSQCLAVCNEPKRDDKPCHSDDQEPRARVIWEIRRSTQPTDDTKGKSVSDLHQTIRREEQCCPKLTKKKKKSTYNKLRLAHHRVRMKNPASTRH